MRNTLYYGDNLEVLQTHIPDSSVDLIYLDPPFNSNRNYNVLFREQGGDYSPAQIKAFDDTWKWANAARDWDNFAEICPVPRLIELMNGFINTLGRNDVTAYLVMMAPRLYHLHRVLKPTGSLYLHCDPTASHYLKLVLDAIFGVANYRNEITWKRTTAHNDASQGLTRFGKNHDVIFFYAKSSSTTWNLQFAAYDEDYVNENYSYIEEGTGRRYKSSDLTAAKPGGDTSYTWKGVFPSKGRYWAYSRANMERFEAERRLIYTKSGMPRLKHYLDEMRGVTIQDTWVDIPPAQRNERLGYPTQKPLALLERIISASSNPGDVVLDPFCGCGTAIVAAQKLERKWIGIDITPIATSLIIARLSDAFNLQDQRLVKAGDPAYARAFAVEGLPTDVAGAQDMFLRDHKAFEMWAVGLVPATPQEKKGADQGIDGLKYFYDGGKKPSKAIVQVKGGGTGSRDVRDLIGTMAREKATLGLFICLEHPTKAMRDEAISAGFYQPPFGGRKVERVQIRTVEDLLGGRSFDLPFSNSDASFKRAAAVAAASSQTDLDL